MKYLSLISALIFLSMGQEVYSTRKKWKPKKGYSNHSQRNQIACFNNSCNQENNSSSLLNENFFNESNKFHQSFENDFDHTSITLSAPSIDCKKCCAITAYHLAKWGTICFSIYKLALSLNTINHEVGE